MPGPTWFWNLLKSLHVELKHESKFFGDTARVSIDGRDVRLLIPSYLYESQWQVRLRLWPVSIRCPENILGGP